MSYVLVGALDDPALVATVFAPTNAAFASLLQTLGITQDQLLASPILPGVLKYHVVPGVAAKVTHPTVFLQIRILRASIGPVPLRSSMPSG